MKFYSVGIHFIMLAKITVNPFLKLIINLRIHMTGHDVVHIESHCVLISNFYTVSDTWIIMIELRSNIFQVSMEFLI